MSERSITYGQLRDQSRALAVRLQKVFNLKIGDTIAVCLPNSIEFPTIVLAGNEAAMTVTTVNPIYTPRKLIIAIHLSYKSSKKIQMLAINLVVMNHAPIDKRSLSKLSNNCQ